MLKKYHIFPFDKVEQGSKIIIYGAGAVGYEYYTQIKSIDWCEVLFFVDKQYSRITSLLGKEVYPPEKIMTVGFDYLLIAAQDQYRNSILNSLYNIGVTAEKVVNSNKGNIIITELFQENDDLYNALSWSQHGDDFVVLNIFNALKIGRPSYIDIGAHHPYDISNTAMLYRSGSRGINIEANPNLIKMFYEARPDDINLNVGVSAKSGVMPFYMFDAVSGINTFVAEEISYRQRKNPDLKIVEVKQIPTVTLSEIIGEYANGVYPDYLDIDIEGMDYEVLSSCDFSAGKPLVINTEIRLDKTAHKMTAMLGEKGYTPYCRMGPDMIYVRKEIKELLLS